jgi:hypothetical protein
VTQIKKSSYIDLIIQENSKKDYPLPGPGAHFLDPKTVKKLVPEEHQEIFQRKQQEFAQKTVWP